MLDSELKNLRELPPRDIDRSQKLCFRLEAAGPQNITVSLRLSASLTGVAIDETLAAAKNDVFIDPEDRACLHSPRYPKPPRTSRARAAGSYGHRRAPRPRGRAGPSSCAR